MVMIKEFLTGETFPDVKYVEIQSNVFVCVCVHGIKCKNTCQTYKKHLDVTQMPQTEVIC